MSVLGRLDGEDREVGMVCVGKCGRKRVGRIS